MTRIACFGLQSTEEAILRQLQKAGREVSFHSEGLTVKNASQFAEVEIVNVLSYATMGEALFSQLPKLKLVTVRATGYNQFDVAYLTRRRIPLMNSQQYCDAAVAEHALLLMLATSKKLKTTWNNSQHGVLQRDVPMMGMDLHGKTVGIWGAGTTAQHFMGICQGLGMNILVHNRRTKPELTERYGATFVDFNTLLTESDVLCLMVAVTPETQGRFNAEAFQRMKPTAYLVNVARGHLINHADLLTALNTQQLAGAGLDVLSDEPLFFTPHRVAQLQVDSTQAVLAQQLWIQETLMRHPKVVHTPHVAFFTQEGVTRMTEQSVENIEAFLAGQPLVRQVNPF
ncbi:MAG: 2-hydroxyacid dehydrogenase [Vampirovibrionales bacterium]